MRGVRKAKTVGEKAKAKLELQVAFDELVVAYLCVEKPDDADEAAMKILDGVV